VCYVCMYAWSAERRIKLCKTEHCAGVN